MLPAYSLFVNENGIEASHVGSAINYRVNEVVWTDSEQAYNSLYRQLVYKVSRFPKRLMFHLQRIYYCFDNKVSEQLYAALIDLFIVLKGKGKALSQRVATDVTSALTKLGGARVKDYLAGNDAALLDGNQYSIFTSGRISSLGNLEKPLRKNDKIRSY